jgi:peptidoglycan/LPS O-acetylase OafA/YrhL
MNKFFPNLNALRFIAATAVVIFHIELYKSFFNIPNLFNLPFFKIVGKLGVVLFFVLSGFLITTLLLNEKEKTGKINFKNFYLRRILRIWPLYFLILILGFFVLPHFSYWEIPKDIFQPVSENFWEKLTLYVLILPNLAVAKYHEVVGVSQSWSLGTEEQFYLIWPVIIVFFRKKLPITLLLILLGYWSLRLFFGKLASIFEVFNMVVSFWNLFNINCMTIGGLFAILYKQNNKIFIRLVFDKYVYYVVLLTLFMSLTFGLKFGFFHYEIYSLFFAVIILNLACNPKYSKVLENKIISYLGSISYGIYMYHPAILPPAIKIAQYYHLNYLIYLITVPVTFIISALSYEYFEKYFLKFKSKFT